MAELVGIIDTGVLCCWLEVPGRSTAGSAPNGWDKRRANTEIDSIIKKKGTLILPLSVIIETANHIAQAAHSRKSKAALLFDKIVAAANGTAPWRNFPEPEILWNQQWYKSAADEWPVLAEQKLGLADYTLSSIAIYFNELGSEVRTLTTDNAVAARVGHLPARRRGVRR